MRNYERGKSGRGAGEGRLAKVSGSLLVRRFSVREPEMFRVVEKVTTQKLTSIDKAALVELAQAVLDLELANLEGDLVQAGGGDGAAIVMASAKRRGRDLIRLDPSVAELPVSDQPIALAHLDSEDYVAMRSLLEQLAPRLVSGGQFIIDDYKTSEQCKRVVDDYFRGKKGFQLVRKSRLHVFRH